MDSNFTIFGLIFLLGSIQGLVLSLYLFFQTEKPRLRSISLGILILILAYDLFETFLSDAKYLSFYVIFLQVLFNFGMGSCIYLYVISSLKPDEKPPKPIWFYFLPLIIQGIIRFIILLVFLGNNKLGNTLFGAHINISQFATVVIFWFFLISSWRKLREYSSNPALTQTELKEVSNWLKLFLIIVATIAVLWTFVMLWATFLPHSFQFVYFYPIQIILVFFIYWVGFKSFQRIKFIYVTAEKNSQTLFDSIPLDEVSETLEKLKIAMEVEKFYLDSELNLSMLAEKTGLKPKIISSVLNQKLGKGFNEFINEYRIDEVKKKLLESKQNLNITEIAFASGFNSLPTFQRAFKAQTSMSPKEFIALHKN